MVDLTDRQRRNHCNRCFIVKKNHPPNQPEPKWWADERIRSHEFIPGEPVPRKILHLGRNYVQPYCLDVVAPPNVLAITTLVDVAKCPECLRRKRVEEREAAQEGTRISVKRKKGKFRIRTSSSGVSSSREEGKKLGTRTIRVKRLRHRR